MNLIERVSAIEVLFNRMHGVNASTWQINEVEKFRVFHPELNDDLDYCFEVLAGKHKLGFTMYSTNEVSDSPNNWVTNINTIREFGDTLKSMTEYDKSEYFIYVILADIPVEILGFMIFLFNREYRLGYSNRKNMVTDLHCMLAKSYPDGVRTTKQYYVQEKLNGNRCIAYYDHQEERWRFTSRSQKEKDYPFDMVGLDINRVYDGEVMSRGRMGNRDFATTSGLANSKYGDKSSLMYFIYDILDSSMPYKERYEELKDLEGKTGHNVEILKVLGKLTIHPNPDWNSQLDMWLDDIVTKGGEGVMLRDPEAPYYHSSGSGDRPNYLLKYKKTKTADLRITGWNEGKGKYEGLIGSFICEDDNKTIKVNVAGMTDAIRMSNPNNWIGKIIEVAYFEGSKAKNKTVGSLQFPRMKAIRPDKTETSLF